jgi:hypothetical protein
LNAMPHLSSSFATQRTTCEHATCRWLNRISNACTHTARFMVWNQVPMKVRVGVAREQRGGGRGSACAPDNVGGTACSVRYEMWRVCGSEVIGARDQCEHQGDAMREVREAKAHPPSSYPRSVSESPSTRTVGKTLFACVAVVAMAARSPSQSPSPPSPHCSLVLSLPPHSHANTPRGAAGPFGAAVQPKATAMATAEAATVATCAVVGGHIPMVSMCSTVSKFQNSHSLLRFVCSGRDKASGPAPSEVKRRYLSSVCKSLRS